MITLDLSNYPEPRDKPTKRLWMRMELMTTLSDFIGRTGQWAQTPPGQVVSGPLWTALGGGNYDPYPEWLPADDTADIDVSHLNRKQLSSLARLLDDFARSHPNTAVIRQFVDGILAEDAAAQTDPHAPRLFDM